MFDLCCRLLPVYITMNYQDYLGPLDLACSGCKELLCYLYASPLIYAPEALCFRVGSVRDSVILPVRECSSELFVMQTVGPSTGWRRRRHMCRLSALAYFSL